MGKALLLFLGISWFHFTDCSFVIVTIRSEIIAHNGLDKLRKYCELLSNARCSHEIRFSILLVALSRSSVMLNMQSDDMTVLGFCFLMNEKSLNRYSPKERLLRTTAVCIFFLGGTLHTIITF